MCFRTTLSLHLHNTMCNCSAELNYPAQRSHLKLPSHIFILLSTLISALTWLWMSHWSFASQAAHTLPVVRGATSWNRPRQRGKCDSTRLVSRTQFCSLFIYFLTFNYEILTCEQFQPHSALTTKHHRHLYYQEITFFSIFQVMIIIIMNNSYHYHIENSP